MVALAGNTQSDELETQGMSWRLRFALLATLCIAVGVVYYTNQLLTTRFAENAEHQLRLRLEIYAANLNSEIQRNKIVPQLMAGDPVLLQALDRQDFAEISARLTTFLADSNADTISIIDTFGVVIASTDKDQVDQFRDETHPYVQALTTDQTVFALLPRSEVHDDFAFMRAIGDGPTPLGVLVLRANFEQFQSVWSGISDAVMVTDSDGRVILTTETAWQGLDETAALGVRSVDSAVRRAARLAQGLPVEANEPFVRGRAVIRQVAPLNFEGWDIRGFTTYDGIRQRVNAFLALEIMVFAIILAAIFYQQSRRILTRALFFQKESEELKQLNLRLEQEIYERQRVEHHLEVAEQTIEQSSKLAALGEMSAAISHELNQPLAAMRTYLAGAKMLLERRRTDEAMLSFHRIDDLIGRMGSITRQMKSHARKGGGALVPVTVQSAVNNSLDLMAPQLEKYQVKIVKNMPKHNVMIMADQSRLEQVLVNLLRNAVDAIAQKDNPEIEVLLIGGKAATLTVTDNGEGVQDFEALFEPFYTTKEAGEGVGLGLAISSGIIADFGGRMTARNTKQGGAAFEIVVPTQPVKDAKDT